MLCLFGFVYCLFCRQASQGKIGKHSLVKGIYHDLPRGKLCTYSGKHWPVINQKLNKIKKTNKTGVLEAYLWSFITGASTLPQKLM